MTQTEPAFRPPRIDGRERRWYRGDCHVHSEISNGGELTAAQLVAGARAAGLDFIATTEHNTADAHGDRGWVDDDLLVILGQEATTASGHWLALGISSGQVIGWDYRARVDGLGEELYAVHQAGGLAVVAHPFAPYPTGRFTYPYSLFDVMEVWNGSWTSDVPWQADNEAALSAWVRRLADRPVPGRWVPAMGNSDTHLNDQIGRPHTVVLADELSSEAVLAGIRAGRSWIAASQTVELSFAVSAGRQRAEIGERLTATNGAPIADIEVRGVPSGVLSIHTENGCVHQEGLSSAGTCTVSKNMRAAQAALVRVEVRAEDGQLAALTNPIFFNGP